MNLLRRCHDCGQPLGGKEVFCPRCGAKQPREPKRAVLHLRHLCHACRKER